MTITTDDLRHLLDADDDAVLLLLEGRTEVVGEDEADDDAHRGALRVITRPELLDRIGPGEPSDHDLAEQAGALDAAIANLGG